MSTDTGLNVILGSGAIGLAVMRQLAERGRQVRIVSRGGRTRAPNGVQVVAADIFDVEARSSAVQGASVIFNCLNPPYTKWPELFPAMQQAAIGAAEDSGARLVVVENLYGYGRVTGPMTEQTPLMATTKKGQVRARMTTDLMEAHGKGRIRATVARGSDYFGPHGLTSAMGSPVFYPMLAGKKVSVVGDPDVPHTYTYLDDFATALVTLSDRDEALGEVWHVPNAETLTTRQFLEVAFEEAGAEPRIGTTPKLMLRLVGMFVRDIGEVVEMLYEFEEPFVVDSSKFTRTFGLDGTPIREALRATVRWFRENPQA